MKLRKHAAVTAAAALTVIAFAAAPAMASGGPPTVISAAASGGPSPAGQPSAPSQSQTSGVPSVCAQQGHGYCLNAWNGGGRDLPVKMYSGGVANDNYGLDYLSLACHDGHVHASAPYGPCPYTVTALDSSQNGGLIVAVRDGRNGLCVATTSSALGATEEGCPNALGQGGGISALWTLAILGSCSGSGYFLENRYWSDAYASLSSLSSGGAIGAQAYVLQQDSVASCWASVST